MAEQELSFTKLLADYQTSKVAGQDEPQEEETVETEVSSQETSKEASTEGTTKLAGINWLNENAKALEKFASDVSGVMDSDDNREVFGRCLDAVTLLKIGGYLNDEDSKTAKDVVVLANELYRSLP